METLFLILILCAIFFHGLSFVEARAHFIYDFFRQEHIGGRKQALSPYEAAQAVFPSLSRSLQKYLRVTRWGVHNKHREVVIAMLTLF